MIVKKLIVLCIISLLLNYNSTNSGEIIYEVEIKNENNTNSEASKKFSLLIKNASNVDFILKFSAQQSTFHKLSTLSNESEKGINLTEIFAGGKDSFYYNNKNKEIINCKEIGGESVLLKKEVIRWKLTKQAKKIGNYNCFKAIALDADGALSNISAWYSVDIPIPFGPNRYNNLPGLIIKLEDDLVTYTAKKITLNKKNIKIDKPTNGVKLSEQEFREKFKGVFSRN